MTTSLTLHAARRCQQRGVPPLITDWLIAYGEEGFDGRGGVVRYFTRRSVRQMERELGPAPLRRMAEYMRCYLVQDSHDGGVITVGKRHRGRRIWRQ